MTLNLIDWSFKNEANCAAVDTGFKNRHALGPRLRLSERELPSIEQNIGVATILTTIYLLLHPKSLSFSERKN